MGVKLIQESTLTDIADAIRGVDGTTALIDPSDYAARISTFSKGEAVITNPIQSIEEAVKAGSLDSLSWKSIEIIADALAAGDITASDANGLLGLYKRFSYGNVTCYAFVIGILQDYLDTAPRGLTF